MDTDDTNAFLPPVAAILKARCVALTPETISVVALATHLPFGRNEKGKQSRLPGQCFERWRAEAAENESGRAGKEGARSYAIMTGGRMNHGNDIHEPKGT